MLEAERASEFAEGIVLPESEGDWESRRPGPAPNKL